MSFYIILYLISGLISGTFLILYARTQNNETKIFAIGLLIAAAIYVVFAVIWGSMVWLFIEIAGVIVFGFIAWLGLRFTKYWLAFGWTTHLIWDWVIHSWGPGRTIAPEWYVFLCISFDLLISGYIIFSSILKFKQRAV